MWSPNNILHIKINDPWTFASDVVAMFAILTVIITKEAFPGLTIFIMQSGEKALEDYAFRKATIPFSICFKLPLTNSYSC